MVENICHFVVNNMPADGLAPLDAKLPTGTLIKVSIYLGQGVCSILSI